jgi:hypothetical protein
MYMHPELLLLVWETCKQFRHHLTDDTELVDIFISLTKHKLLFFTDKASFFLLLLLTTIKILNRMLCNSFFFNFQRLLYFCYCHEMDAVQNGNSLQCNF